MTFWMRVYLYLIGLPVTVLIQICPLQTTFSLPELLLLWFLLIWLLYRSADFPARNSPHASDILRYFFLKFTTNFGQRLFIFWIQEILRKKEVLRLKTLYECFRIRHDRFKFLAEQIVELFPTEVEASKMFSVWFWLILNRRFRGISCARTTTNCSPSSILSSAGKQRTVIGA